MQGNRSRDTLPELAVRSAVHALGLRYRVCTRPLPDLRRTADLVFTRVRVAVFIDGCFWHGCPTHRASAASHTAYWVAKLAHNRQRDRDTDQRLENAGWTVVRVWEHEEVQAAALRIAEAVRNSRRSA
jgi:DNA mismatch endonuclease (patch repair protein)